MIPVYVSYLIYTFVVIARSRDDNEVKDIFILTHIQLGISVIFFVLLPVTFPRDQFYYNSPLPSLFNDFWLLFDKPYNCFPSLHTILCLTAIRHSRHKPFQLFYVSWGFLIIISTLTCKQHYVADFAAGVVVYFISVKLFSIYCSWSPGNIPVAPPSHKDQKKSSK
jgi:membrane-associated phospholipid phosphatase